MPTLSAKVRIFFGFGDVLNKRTIKYLFSTTVVLFAVQLVFGFAATRSGAAAFSNDSLRRSVAAALADEPSIDPDRAKTARMTGRTDDGPHRDRTEAARRTDAPDLRSEGGRSIAAEAAADTTALQPFEPTASRRETRRAERRRSRRPLPAADTLAADTTAADSTVVDSLPRDTVRTPRPAKRLIDDPITGRNADSLVYDVRNKLVYIYNLSLIHI